MVQEEKDSADAVGRRAHACTLDAIRIIELSGGSPALASFKLAAQCLIEGLRKLDQEAAQKRASVQ